ncbi:MAG: primosomal protein N' [Candidatus Omnitrophota bacterium]
MLYAKVVLGLPVEGPFDYIVPVELQGKISVGARVWVNFRNKKSVGFVVGLSKESNIKNLKEVTFLIDQTPLLNSKFLELTKKLSDYYCCSWGEAIETALPVDLRKGKLVDGDSSIVTCSAPSGKIETVLLEGGNNRWEFYLKRIRQTLENKRSVIVLCSDIPAAQNAKALIEKELGREVYLSFRKQKTEFATWQKIRENDFSVVLGTRSAIFSPVNNLGLIIVDREEDSVYKQEQVPHYHARQAALMRAKLENADIILGSFAPSVESFYLTKTGELEYRIVPRKSKYPQIQTVDMRKLSYAERKNKAVFTRAVSDAVYNTLSQKGKVLLFLNRIGFATCAACHNCKAILKCPRCDLNLIYHFDEQLLRCHHCSFKMVPPKICPVCESGYIKYSGLGTQKMESELARMFPQARIKIVEHEVNLDLAQADIFVAASSIIKHEECDFDLVAAIDIDSALNRLDWAASEKVFTVLRGLTSLTSKKIIVQTSNPLHHIFYALFRNDDTLFYTKELRSRKQLRFPPYRHLILVKIRGEDLEKVKKASLDLFEKLKQEKTRSIKVLSLNPGQPAKLRNNYYYQVLASCADILKANKFLKSHLKETRYSGIIVTVDVDPV